MVLTDAQFSKLSRLVNDAETQFYFILNVYKDKRNGKIYYVKQLESEANAQLYCLDSDSLSPSIAIEHLERLDILENRDFDADSELKRIFS